MLYGFRNPEREKSFLKTPLTLEESHADAKRFVLRILIFFGPGAIGIFLTLIKLKTLNNQTLLI